MLSLSDSELQIITEAAKPIPAQHRSEFLRNVADELAKYPEIGDGVIHRVVGKIQREHLHRPRYAHSTSKWDR